MNSYWENQEGALTPPSNIDSDYDPYDSDSYELPPLLDFDFDPFPFDHNSDDDSKSTVPKKRGRKVNDQFPEPPLGKLQHPHIGWVVDKATLDRFIDGYAAQEGTALISHKERGNVIRYRCIHGGKYNNHRNLPVEVIGDKAKQEQVLQRGTTAH